MGGPVDWGKMCIIIEYMFWTSGIDNFGVDASKAGDVPGYGGGGGNLLFACEDDGVEELGKMLRLHNGLALSDSDDETCVEVCEVFDVDVCCCCLAACVW